MIGPEMGRAAFRLGMTVTLPAVSLLFVVHPGTAAFAVTVLTVLIGVLFMAFIALLVRYFSA